MFVIDDESVRGLMDDGWKRWEMDGLKEFGQLGGRFEQTNQTKQGDSSVVMRCDWPKPIGVM